MKERKKENEKLINIHEMKKKERLFNATQWNCFGFLKMVYKYKEKRYILLTTECLYEIKRTFT